MATHNITLPQELISELEAFARAQNKIADNIAAEAVWQHLIRGFGEQNKLDAAQCRGKMSESEIAEAVEQAIYDSRN